MVREGDIGKFCTEGSTKIAEGSYEPVASRSSLVSGRISSSLNAVASSAKETKSAL